MHELFIMIIQTVGIQLYANNIHTSYDNETMCNIVLIINAYIGHK